MLHQDLYRDLISMFRIYTLHCLRSSGLLLWRIWQRVKTLTLTAITHPMSALVEEFQRVSVQAALSAIMPDGSASRPYTPKTTNISYDPCTIVENSKNYSTVHVRQKRGEGVRSGDVWEWLEWFMGKSVVIRRNVWFHTNLKHMILWKWNFSQEV